VNLDVQRSEEGMAGVTEKDKYLLCAEDESECNLLLKFLETHRWKEETLNNR
jgi:hypothetical protein